MFQDNRRLFTTQRSVIVKAYFCVVLLCVLQLFSALLAIKSLFFNETLRKMQATKTLNRKDR
jgi:hypothetical protein